MATPSVPTTEPTVFTAGDTLKFTRSHPDYLPTDGWVITYALVNSSAQISITGSDNGDGTHLVSVAAATTASWTAGDYRWQAYVTKATTSERYRVGVGEIEIRTNFAAQTSGYDGRSAWTQTLEALEAGMLSLASGSMTTVEIQHGEHRLKFRTIDELRGAIDLAKREVAKEEAAEATINKKRAGSLVKVYMQ